MSLRTYLLASAFVLIHLAARSQGTLHTINIGGSDTSSEDSLKYTVLKLDSAVFSKLRIPGRAWSGGDLSDEIQPVVDILNDCFASHPTLYHNRLSSYSIQIVPYEDEINGRSYWVNAFPSTWDDWDWSARIVKVHDGGDAFFNVKIFPTTKGCIDFRYNGM